MSCSDDKFAAMSDLVVVGCCQVCHKRPATIFADTDPTCACGCFTINHVSDLQVQAPVHTM